VERREGRDEGRVRGVMRGGKGRRERGHEGAWGTPKAPLRTLKNIFRNFGAMSLK